MKPEDILKASMLDIVFDGRNKQYGAYALRRTYNAHLIEALLSVAVLTGSLFGVDALTRHKNVAPAQTLYVRDVQLEEVKDVQRNEPPPPPPPPPKAEIPKIEMTKFTPPRIVKDEEVKAQDMPPEQEKLQDTRIGTINQEGVKDEGLIAPPVSDAGKGVIEAPAAKATEDYEKTFVKVEIESEYPGGPAAWLRYLNKTFRYPEDGLNNEIQGTVVVQFIVDKEGKVSEVQAISGPELGGLREEAVRVIRGSGDWIPAIQNGRKVKSYKKQPVIFRLMQQ
ncbi:MAG: TonB family protein [Bacteroidetes bacterium]|nr:TonB family protein [Bacteroidota bacterium]